jgi:signal transduction histidine kinase
MDHQSLKALVDQILKENKVLETRERELAERTEELQAQKEELTAAIEAVIEKSDSLELANEELKKRNHELDQILYRTSHDLRSPISSMEGLLLLLKDEASRESSLTIQKHLLAKVYQMKDVMDALGTLAHASFDKINFETIPLQALVSKLIDELAYLHEQKKIRFQIDIDPHLTISSDRYLLATVLKALLSNAILFRSDDANGEVIVHAEMQKELKVNITDNGDGIAPEVAPRIFEMFYRGSAKSTGLGLGLYIVKKVLDRISGLIMVESSKGRTTFSITLPQH